ncbi:uncharacterized protein A1O9_09283 [Exophiala aquamarina CBS 119918]|uniref:Zn(2)-C6 fungal-type domain-containing protein n=1 Tax=Exophiala aquamarina CBS 119918 TaxID=1182545 RepID=A0A072P4T3_9EURO|nr:uncharacterized protein A1O9_09283 [Exophiala aquamarina CBS 119918]KEF54841.1 hypothetical protein A1O9_09283 [Exophiala aquamarina CBS 119918]
MEAEALTTDVEARRAPTSRQSKAPSPMNLSYKGRVRTGCLVCRARKVKCDEQRPTCRKCLRLKRACVYRIPSRWEPPIDSNLGPEQYPQNPHSTELGPGNVSPQTESGDYANPSQHAFIGASSYSGSQEIPSMSHRIELSDHHLPASGNSNESSPNPHAHHLRHELGLNTSEIPTDRFRQTSHLIYLSTIVDWMAASEMPNPSSFSYFIEVVDCPLLSPFDTLNWTRVKHHIALLGSHQTSVAESLLAVQALYRAQVDRLPMAHAISVYQAAVIGFESISTDDEVDFEIVLVDAFLICLCAVTLPNEDGPHLAVFGGAFETRLETWLLNRPQSPIPLRICAWLQLLNTTTKRPGSAGLLSTSVPNLLSDHIKEVPSLSTLDHDAHPERYLYDAVATPIFTFYLKLQTMSNRVADVTHYRRSRTTPQDQEEVTELMAALKKDLAYLWANRPAPMQLQPDKVREHFSVQISDPLIALAGLCIAAFHAEVIVVGRILGEPPLPSSEAMQALEQIRAVVQGDWNVSADGGLNPGYVRPLFVYALESFERDDSQWAVDRLRQIKHPISRGNFLASFVEAHGEAQRAQSRRVTMKYFCYKTFGVPLPFM